MATDYSMFQLIILLAVAVFVYFIPNWIASARNHHNADAIFMTNLLLGWTAIGWIAALIWSLTAVRNEASEPPKASSELKQCPFCAEDIKKEAIVCRYCGREIPK